MLPPLAGIDGSQPPPTGHADDEIYGSSVDVMAGVGELVRSTTGQWIARPPLRCSRGHDAIREFYAAFQDAEKQTELVELRVSGSDAVFLWQLMLDVGDSRTKISPISQMTFDDDAKITSMRAFWSPEDAHVV